MAGTWTDPARDDIAAYDPEFEAHEPGDPKAPGYFERITDGSDGA